MCNHTINANEKGNENCAKGSFSGSNTFVFSKTFTCKYFTSRQYSRSLRTVQVFPNVSILYTYFKT